MKNILIIIIVFLTISGFSQTVNVTFQVDMSSETVSGDGVHVTGSINSWNTSANSLTDQGNNIYAITISLDQNTYYEYKYLNGNAWGTEEAAPATCTVSGNNRFFTTSTNDTILPAVPFNTCLQQVIFQVDMSNETVSGDGIHIAGNFNSWNTTATSLTDQGNGIYAVNIPLYEGTNYEYKYLNGNAWGTEEAAPATCTVGGNNRTYTTPATATSDITLSAVPFNGCLQNVTFQVDMSGETISADGVHIAGNFNNWNTSSDKLIDQGSNIYAITLELREGTDYQYKYLNGNAWGTEETASSACAVGNNNRIFTTPATATANMTLSLVPFDGCPTPNPTQDVTFRVDMSNETVSGNGVHVTGNFNGWVVDATPMTDVGNDIYEVTATVLSSITTLQYKYINGNGWSEEETVPTPCKNDSNNRHLNIENEGATIALPTYDFGTCTEAALPVELLFFKGKKVNEGILLEWETASEQNNEGFQIENSIDGKNWKGLAFIEGQGNTQRQQTYSYLDEQPSSNVNYYRLKQIDFNGQFDYSNLITVVSTPPFKSVSIYPNPIQNQLNILNAKGQLILYNMIGQPLKNLAITEEVFQLNTENLERGTYLLVIQKEDGNRITQVIIK